MKRAPSCHPTRTYFGRGLCRSCYHHARVGGTLDQFPLFRNRRGDGQSLSPREIQSLIAVARHSGSKGAAYALGISTQTIKNHLSSVYVRLGVETYVEALLALGWLRLPDEAEDVAA